MGTFLFSRVGGVLVVALKFLGGEMSDQLRYLITLNCLDGNMNEVLSMGPKHPIGDKVNETHFLADIHICLSQLKNQNTSGELYVK